MTDTTTAGPWSTPPRVPNPGAGSAAAHGAPDAAPAGPVLSPETRRMRFGGPGVTGEEEVGDALQRVILRHGALSVFTVGFYRFWMKTFLRRVIWRETRIHGEGFEYTGTPLELLVGTMIAIAFLAVWLGLANMLLSFGQMALWQNAEIALFIAVPIALPVVQYAIYRARRYRLLRTRWRGIRCGMDGSAFRYVGIWFVWTIVQVLTLWLATPWKTVALERYKTNHMLYGDARFRFEGRVGGVFWHWLFFWLSVAIPVGAIGYSAWASGDFPDFLEGVGQAADNDPTTSRTQVYAGLAFGVAWMLGLFAYPLYLRYKSRLTALLIRSRRIEGAEFHCELTWGAYMQPTWAVLGRSIFPGMVVGLVIALLAFLTVAVARAIDGQPEPNFFNWQTLVFTDFKTWPAKALYILSIWVYYGLSLLFTMWLWSVVYFRRVHRNICEATTITGLDSLADVRQRTRDDQITSEGFADALDVGGL